VRTFSYKDAGVDVEKGDAFVQAIKPMVESTFRPEVLTKIDGFAGCVSLNLERHKKPILVSSTDGVGTKLKLAFVMDRHDTVGIDLVAMILSVRSKEVEDILARLQTLGEKAYMIGEVGKTKREEGTIEFV
jgi:phosphoribosylaminoimidazole (AIR) synthetase